MVAPQVRLELTTLRLTAECSAIELLRIIRGLWRGLLSARRSALSASGTFTLVFGARPGFAHHFWLALRLGSCLCFATCSAVSARFRSPPRSPYVFGSGKNFRSSRSSWIPATSYSPKPFPAQYHQRLEGLTSVFGMGTGGALQLSSPETFRREASLAPPPRTFKTAQQSS